MLRKVVPIISLVVCFLAINGVEGRAAMINANSPSSADVQRAIDSSVSGDIVNVPSGSATWSASVSIPNTKKITLQGSGMDSTIITVTRTAIIMNESCSRVTGFGFILSAGDNIIDVKGRGWRIDHCRFNNTTGESRVSIHPNGINVTTEPAGLIDHNVFINGRILITPLATFDKMCGIWSKGLNLGTDDAVYVEDNTFTRNDSGARNAVDTNRGGKYVFRYNNLTNTYLEAHSLQNDQERATRKWEIYNNTINAAISGQWAPMFIRGGTGVIFNNTIKGSWGNRNIILDNVRSCNTIGSSGSCNGSSDWDGNEIEGYPCRDQIGRSTDQWAWTSGNPYPPQSLEPAYFWNNKYSDGSDIGVTLHNCSASQSQIKQNRDWYLGTPKPGYTPFTYPHPLSTGGTGTTPTTAPPGPPSNLRVQ